MIAPNFFILGTAKAGTTSLYHYLSQHPDICLTDPKETWFFDSSAFQEGLAFYQERYFRHWAGEPIVGEVASSYLYVPYVHSRLKAVAPHTKLVAVLRHPVDRCYSDWWMLYSRGIEDLPFKEAVSANLRRLKNGPYLCDDAEWSQHLETLRRENQIRHRTYVDYGYYAMQVRRYQEVFSAAQLKFVSFSDLKRDPRRVVKEILQFLELEPIPLPGKVAAHNVAVPNRMVGRIIKLLEGTGIRKRLPAWIKQLVTSSFSKLPQHESLSSTLRQELIEHYRESNRALEEILDWRLPHWYE